MGGSTGGEHLRTTVHTLRLLQERGRPEPLYVFALCERVDGGEHWRGALAHDCAHSAVATGEGQT